MTEPTTPQPTPDPASALDRARALIEPQVRLLARLAEIGLEVAEAIALQVKGETETPVAKADPSLAYARVSRAVRLTLWTREGFSIWWSERGDLDYFDFWSYQKKPSEFALKSAFHFPALDAFEAANAGKVLTPSHRVAVDADRPAIQTFRVQQDGSDVVESMIGPDDIGAMTPDEICLRLGRMLLTGTEAGRRLLGYVD